jgi:hypothetical protein
MAYIANKILHFIVSFIMKKYFAFTSTLMVLIADVILYFIVPFIMKKLVQILQSTPHEERVVVDRPQKKKTNQKRRDSAPVKKKIPMNNIVVGISPSPKISLVKHEVDCRNKNMVCMVGGGDVKLQNHKIDFTRVKARVDTAKKTQMLNSFTESHCTTQVFGHSSHSELFTELRC